MDAGFRPSQPRTRFSRSGLTLVELMIVLIVLVALAGILTPLVATTIEDSMERTTRASLVAVRDAVMRQWLDTKYVSLPGSGGSPATVASEAERFQIRWLFDSPVSGTAVSDFDPDTRVGWNGPYLAQSTGRYAVDVTRNLAATYGSDNDPAILDSYTGTPIVIQVVGSTSPYEVRIVSAGVDGVLDIDPMDATEDLETEGGSEPVNDDIFVSFVLR